MRARPGLSRQLGAVFLSLVLAGCAVAPPVQEMSDARQAIAAAEAADAAVHSPRALEDARRFISVAERQIREETYGPARANAVRAKNRAVRALQDAEAAQDSVGN
jgi:hypothetical protein